MTNSRAKGARGERYVAKHLRENYNLPDARRGQQYCGLAGNADVVGGFPNTHSEVKFVEKLNIDKAMAQAARDCGSAIALCWHKKNQGPLFVTVRASDLKQLAKAVIEVS